MGTLPEEVRKGATLIDKTMGSALDTTGEIQQLTQLFSGIRVALRAFNVKAPVYNGPGTDIAFSDLSSGTKYIFGRRICLSD